MDSDTRKPPMVVWLQNQQSLNEQQWQDEDVTWCRDRIFQHDVGPYVHLDQFMAEVEKRAAKLFGQSFHTATQADCFRQAVRELAKEIKEQK